MKIQELTKVTGLKQYSDIIITLEDDNLCRGWFAYIDGGFLLYKDGSTRLKTSQSTVPYFWGSKEELLEDIKRFDERNW